MHPHRLRAYLRLRPADTRLLVEHDRSPILRARLAPLSSSHPAALEALLTALSLWQTSPLFAVLGVAPAVMDSSWAASRLTTERVVARPLGGGDLSFRALRLAADHLGEREVRHGVA